ncbi:MarR family winged helix-turn-helix transcriptional regulator [Litorisediminicola beolgyonensis]|uniref:MarR family winged helix-turn-helix transcriptional regulator n=1 Tax=Litorisediminicola beolgyonensis TaxID=1173614 RepID=A0ABW3ZKJ6_9RHOB
MSEASGKSRKQAALDAPLARYAGYHLRRTTRLFLSDVAQVLKPLGLRMITFSTLATISGAPGIRQSRLASVLAVEKPNLVAILEELEGRGLILRERLESDRRVYVLKTTAEGEALVRQAHDAVEEHEERLMSPLDETERRTLIEMLAKVRAAASEG